MRNRCSPNTPVCICACASYCTEWGVGLRIPLTGGGESQSNRIKGYTNSKTAQCCQNGLVRASQEENGGGGGRQQRGLSVPKYWKLLEHLQIFSHIWTVWHRLQQQPSSFVHHCLPKNAGSLLLFWDWIFFFSGC